jgi:hypothetical protein
MRRSLLVVVTLFAALLVLPTSKAWACSCAGLSVPEAVSRADTVVTAGVVSAHGESKWSPEGAARYELAVRSVYKGTATTTTWVADDPGSCGLVLQPGREYVVFIDHRDGELVSSDCAGNTQAASGTVAQVEQQTGPPTAAPVGATGGPGENTWLWPVFGGMALALLLGAGLVVVLVRGHERRRRDPR